MLYLFVIPSCHFLWQSYYLSLLFWTDQECLLLLLVQLPRHFHCWRPQAQLQLQVWEVEMAFDAAWLPATIAFNSQKSNKSI